MNYREMKAALGGVIPEIRSFIEEKLASLNERLRAVEERAATPGPPGPQGPKGDAGGSAKEATGVRSVSVRDGDLIVVLTDGTEHNAGRVKGDAGERGERGGDGVGIVGPVGPPGASGGPGADGRPGRDGRDAEGTPGKDGKDGRDGITPEQLKEIIAQAKADGAAELLAAIEFDGRTWKLGDRTVRTPAPQYRGVYAEGEDYDRGDFATWAGSLWHANGPTKGKPGDGEPSWTLVAKKGRDGRDGKDGAPAAPRPVVAGR